MSAIPALDPALAPADAKATLTAVNAALGMTPNMFRVAANSPAVLNGFAQMSGSLAKGKLRAKARESIALLVAQENGCDYCLSAHTVLGKGAGLSDEDVRAARENAAGDEHLQAILSLAATIVRTRGAVGPDAVADAKAAELDDAEIVETIANVALNIFTNYLNIVAATEIDFPVVRATDLVRA
jgi:uncharacterized peroxidase-related enzyme